MPLALAKQNMLRKMGIEHFLNPLTLWNIHLMLSPFASRVLPPPRQQLTEHGFTSKRLGYSVASVWHAGFVKPSLDFAETPLDMSR